MDFKSMETFLKNDLFESLVSLQDFQLPEWGIMTPQHMVEHLGGLIILSTKENNLGIEIDESIKKERKQWFFEQVNDLPKNMLMVGEKTPKLFDLRFENLDEARNRFLRAVTHFFSSYSQNPTLIINHPFFGLLNYQDWVYFHYKHSKHHLAQFGLVSL